MKIESVIENKKLKDLKQGNIFFYLSELYIKTGQITDGLCECVSLESGFLEFIIPEANVDIVEDVVLKIGG